MDFYKIYLLGNGFDLAHKLPTNYDCFLHTLNFLEEHFDDSMTNLGAIFGNKQLHNKNSFIADSYLLYSMAYDAVPIDNNSIKDYISKYRNNLWYKYLTRIYNKEIGWIDFENEIKVVINAFRDFLNNTHSLRFSFSKYNASTSFIIKNFPFFWNKKEASTFDGKGYEISSGFRIAKPYNSENIVADTNCIINELCTSLYEFADILRIYLKYFVEKLTHNIVENKLVRKLDVFNNPNFIYTFNYTKTPEIIYEYDLKSICHVHGSLNTNVVLGVEADQHDELENMDTTFIRFKKYYQRILYETDFFYKSAINGSASIKKTYSKSGDKCALYVIGHSLDKTDQEIITDLFDLADHIVIYYYKSDNLQSYIQNLTEIYGKAGFDNLRRRTNLVFEQL